MPEEPDPDEIGRIRALAEDALARADHALAKAGDAVARAESLGADGLARADHAVERSGDAVARAGSLGADAVARADHASAKADDAIARAEALGADATARADHAVAKADDAIARAEALGADGIARADHAIERSGDAIARAESLGADAVARGDHALARADDAMARADHAVTRADDALVRADAALALAEHAKEALDEALLPARMAAFAAWLELRPPLEETLVSIVLPTRDRQALLPRAIASVLEQLYDRWELIVVDDGDTDAVASVLAEVEDERIVAVEGPRRGLSAARNAGLDAAAGDLVCYLDDDNVMHPAWLQAVVHVFAERDDVDVAYGVAVAEHRRPGLLEPAEWWPAFWQLPWSRRKLLEENLTDAGALAHRRDLAGARFDDLGSGEDWDLLIRLTADRPALAIPAVSHAYAMSGEDRMSHDPRHRAILEDIRRRHAGS